MPSEPDDDLAPRPEVSDDSPGNGEPGPLKIASAGADAACGAEIVGAIAEGFGGCAEGCAGGCLGVFLLLFVTTGSAFAALLR